MPFDVDARVLWNRRLSPDYNVLALEAPAIAAATEPGQFVMIRPGHDLDPLLRRPFSIFEIVLGEAPRRLASSRALRRCCSRADRSRSPMSS